MPPNEDVVEEYRLLLDDLLKLGTTRGDIVNRIRDFQKYHDDDAGETMESSEFHLEETIATFGLQHDMTYSASEPQGWRIEEIPETKGFEPSHCFESLLRSYAQNFDRTSRAVYRTAVNFILNECLTAMKDTALLLTSHGQTIGGHSTLTPPALRDIKVFGDLSFSHKITPMDDSSSRSPYSGVTVTGRVDHAIGRTTFRRGHSIEWCFQSLLLLVATALAQLVVYLGSLHESRLSRNWSDSSIYGVVSDGYLFTFVAITHHGVLKQSRQFDTPLVLGCLRYLLEKSAAIVLDKNTGLLDPAIDLRDNPYTHPPDDDDDDD
ncbi:hypothetical protein BS47DRAFT_1347914 [Hydnum rufescens UP504]|uniref:Uncharacterized protein n=1 Tax=Hydnum rufescens UP504 TaxID=1448309 RepID=A0A9P6ARB4_9AGAM|nr:hypothetical protein BS47DRAFT_1347914 [Hydnum rufescens UP504]